MARSKRDDEINRAFERQGRRLNRQWTRNAVTGFVALVVLIVVLQFTPYRNIHRDIIDAASNLWKKMTSGQSAPVEPSPKYW